MTRGAVARSLISLFHSMKQFRDSLSTAMQSLSMSGGIRRLACFAVTSVHCMNCSAGSSICLRPEGSRGQATGRMR